MKKIWLLALMMVLTGCGTQTRCEYKFDTSLTKDYKKDAAGCESVTYINEENNIKFVTTPINDGNSFMATINYNNRIFNHSFADIELVNANLNKVNNFWFLELYSEAESGNVYLVLFDKDGNVKYELGSTATPVFDGDKFTVREYLKIPARVYSCADYNANDVAYREKTYDMNDMKLLDSKEIKIKDICK